MPVDETERTRRRYNRLARFYDLMERPIEGARFSLWRTRFTNAVRGPAALEAGVGTGKNMPHYPAGVRITSIDLTPGMLEQAEDKARRLGLDADLRLMDVQDLDFPDNSFDTVFSSFVFCSVPDPVRGLGELWRVCRPGGRLFLLEHVRPENPLAGLLFDILNPFMKRMTGANINRRTVDNVRRAGWAGVREERLWTTIVRWIEAEKQA